MKLLRKLAEKHGYLIHKNGTALEITSASYNLRQDKEGVWVAEILITFNGSQDCAIVPLNYEDPSVVDLFQALQGVGVYFKNMIPFVFLYNNENVLVGILNLMKPVKQQIKVVTPPGEPEDIGPRPTHEGSSAIN